MGMEWFAYGYGVEFIYDYGLLYVYGYALLFLYGDVYHSYVIFGYG